MSTSISGVGCRWADVCPVLDVRDDMVSDSGDSGDLWTFWGDEGGGEEGREGKTDFFFHSDSRSV